MSAWTFVNACALQPTNTGPIFELTSTWPVTKGNLLALLTPDYQASTNPAFSATDSFDGASWAIDSTPALQGTDIQVLHRVAPQSGVVTVTASLTNGYSGAGFSLTGLFLAEYAPPAGAEGGIEFDKFVHGYGNTAGAGAVSPGSVSAAGVPPLLIGGVVFWQGQERTATPATAGYTQRLSIVDGTGTFAAFCDQSGTTAGGYGCDWTLGAPASGGGGWNAILASFRVVPPVRLDAWQGKSRKVIFFGAAATAPTAGAGYPLMQVTAVDGSPSIKRNGTPVAIGPVAFYPDDQWPLAVFPVQFGAVDRIAIVDGGEGITNATVSWVPGSGGGTSLVLGTPTYETGVTGYTIGGGGSGFTSAPTISVGTPPGYSCTDTTSGYTYEVKDPGSPYRAFGTATVSGGAVTSVVPAAGGPLGCGTGYEGTTPAATVSGGGGTGATVTPRVASYLATVPVVSSSNDFTSLPSFTITYGGGTPARGAQLLAMMSGASPGDALTYSAPSGWLAATYGGASTLPVPAVADAPIGSTEGSPAFAVLTATPTMPAGCNLAEVPLSPALPTVPCMNLAFAATGWTTAAAAAYTADANGNPYSWSPGVLFQRRINNSVPGTWGTYTAIHGDRHANTAAAASVRMGTNLYPAPLNISCVNLSGPNVGTTTGAVLADADVGWNGTSITSLSLANSPDVTSGTGYQAAIVVVTDNGTGRESFPAFATAVVSGGKVISCNLIYGGNYGIKPTVAIYGAGFDGVSEVRQQWKYSATSATASNPEPWLFLMAPPNNDGNSDGTCRWTLDFDEWVVLPNPDGTAVPSSSISRSDRLAAHPAVLAALSSGTKAISHLRVMDSTGGTGYGGDNNGGYPSSFTDPDGDWLRSDTTTGVIAAARHCNTDPAKGPAAGGGDGTYAWLSDKVYGTQPYFPSGNLNPSFTMTGTTTTGSNRVTGITGITSPLGGLMTGSTISGPGIPAGSYIGGLRDGGATAILGGPQGSATATASGTVTLTVQDPPYILLPASDRGMFANHQAGSGTGAVAELRFSAPHGITTGEAGVTTGTGVAISWTNCSSQSAVGQQFAECAWVTGPFTIVMETLVNGYGLATNDPNTPQFVDSTTEYPTPGTNGTPFQLTIDRPFSGPTDPPVEFMARLARDLPGCALWVSLPVLGNSAMHQEYGRRAYLQLGPGRDVVAEYWNEIWAGGQYQPLYPQGVLNLLSYLPAGTSVLGGHYVADGTLPPYGAFSFGPLLSAKAQDDFAAGWVAAGGDATRIKRPAGGFYQTGGSGAAYTGEINQTATQHGLTFDYVLAGPYLEIPGTATVDALFAPAGSTAGAQSLAIDGIIDIIRHVVAYRLSWQQFFGDNYKATGGKWPTICYEGAIDVPIPGSVPFSNHLSLDAFASPAARDMVMSWYFAKQAGQQDVAGSGCVAACYYQASNNRQISTLGTNNPASWCLSEGWRQPPGDGYGTAYSGSSSYSWPGGANRAVTIQGGADYVGYDPAMVAVPGVATPLQGLRDWFGGTATAPAPTVTATAPAGGATRVAIGTSIAVTYSGAMDASSLTLTLQASGGGTIACPLAGYNSSTNVATFSPASPLAAGTTYAATADGTGATGIAMAAADQWSFTTAYPAPSVSSVSPTAGAIGVATSTTLTATFAGAVDGSSVAFTLKHGGGASVNGSTGFAGGVGTFTPAFNLGPATTYDATATASAPDGTAMASPASWSFTTSVLPPTVGATVPASGATGVSPTAAITATFSEAIDPASLSLTLSPSTHVRAPTWDAGTLTASWTPMGAGLAYATTCTATVSARAPDGTTMTAPCQWSFATHDAPPSGHGLVVSTGYTVPTAVDASAATVAVTDSAGNPVAGTGTWDPTNRLVNFLPTAPYAAGAKYLVRISGLKAADGKAIPDITYPVIPGPQRSTGWVGGLGRAN